MVSRIRRIERVHHDDRIDNSSSEWPHENPFYGIWYNLEDEFIDQTQKLPSPAQIEELLSALRVSTLREMSIEVLNSGVEHVKGSIDRLEYAKFLNSWIATAEEAVAAGRNVNRIAARRNR